LKLVRAIVVRCTQDASGKHEQVPRNGEALRQHLEIMIANRSAAKIKATITHILRLLPLRRLWGGCAFRVRLITSSGDNMAKPE
jgi:hypothetical protein